MTEKQKKNKEKKIWEEFMEYQDSFKDKEDFSLMLAIFVLKNLQLKNE